MCLIYLFEVVNFEGCLLIWEIRKIIIDNVKKLVMLV